MTNAGGMVPVCVILAFGTMEIEEEVRRAAVTAASGHCVLVAGVVFIAYRSDGTRQRWEFSLSHWGQPPVVVSVHRLKRDIEAQMRRMYRANIARDLSDAAVFAALIQELAAFGDRDAGRAA